MSVSTVFKINTGDLSPSVQAVLQNSDGSVVNLQNCTALFVMTQNDQTLFSKSASIIDAVNGIVKYDWQAGDTDYYGVCEGKFIVTLPNSLTQSFPVAGVFYIIFPLQPQPVPQLMVTAFTSFTEVMTHLNVEGPNNTGNYSVYGLPVSQKGIQAHVDHANKYLYSLVPSISDQSDSRYVSAELAALDIACLGVLVTVVGGSLVGAYDYSLSDMHVSRAGPFASAIKVAIDAYRQSAIGNLLNVSTIVKSVRSSRHIPHYSGPELSP